MSLARIVRTQSRLATATFKTCTPRVASRVLGPQLLMAASRSFSTAENAQTTRWTRNSPNAQRKRPTMQPNPPSPSLFIGGLPVNTTEQDLRDLFSQFGKVASVTLGEANALYTNLEHC
jgi:hypothetical protein